MSTLEIILTDWIRGVFRDALALEEKELAGIEVAATANANFGDYQCNAAMPLAKTMHKPPRQIAQAVLDKMGKPEFLEKAEIAGAGFINIFLRNDWLCSRATTLIKDERMGVPMAGEGKTVILDYSSPNVAKPMHIGHIRSTIIGNAIDRMHRFLGYRVVSDNHLGDWGTQFGILIMGYRNFLDKEALERAPVEELERLYVKSYDKAKNDEAWMNACRAELVKLQAGDKENLALWKEFVAHSLREFDRIYGRLGVRFDTVRGESFYNDQLGGVIADLAGRGLAVPSDGATVVFLEEEKLPVCIVRKADGGFNYATTDLATVQTRVREYKPDRIVYVTDERQQLHFRQWFAIARRIGIQTPLDHVWFGLMRLPEGTFSTREGNVIKLERLLDEAESRALEIVRKSSPEMPADRQAAVARAVGIGAVKYADLSQNLQTNVVFTWDKALALDGNSAPYLQYAYARIASVRDKFAEQFPGVDPTQKPIQISVPVERLLILKLSRFPEVVIRAALGYRPNYVADYLYDLAQTYSTFYQNVPFLKAEEGLRESRVQLCVLTARVLKKGLELLGIDTPERI